MFPRSSELVEIKQGETLTKQRINKAAHDVIASRHATLWGRAYGVYEKGGLDDAADWLTDEVVRVLKELGVAITDDNFTQGTADGQRPRQLTGIEIEDLCDEDD